MVAAGEMGGEYSKPGPYSPEALGRELVGQIGRKLIFP